MDLEYQIRQWIESKSYVTANKKLQNQTWESFNSACDGQDVYIFGAGAMASLLVRRESNTYKVKGIIDNDNNKQGRRFSDYYDDVDEELKILAPSNLLDYSPDKVVILIASINHFEDIAQQLCMMGIINYYSAIHMEYNLWLKTSGNDCIDDPICNQRSSLPSYAAQCARTEQIKDNKIVFYSVNGFGNHEESITKKLLSLRIDLDIVWIVPSLSIQAPCGARIVYIGKKKTCIREMETARIWITGVAIPSYFVKRDRQCFIHVKHWASITLKKFYLDAPSVANRSQNRMEWEQMGRAIDYIFVGSDFDANSCIRGLSRTATMIYVGSPRSDTLFSSDNYKKKLHSLYQFPKDCSIMLYAPTYRFQDVSTDTLEKYVLGNVDLDFQSVLAALKRYSGKDWVIFLRLHPTVVKYGSDFLLPDGVINVSDYPDSEELVAASDAMISDYSSIMFEPAFVRKPVFLYAPDQETYIDNEYELLLDYHSLPFPIAATNEELVHNIETFDYKQYVRDVDTFMKKYGVHEDGHASERAAQFILELIDGKRG